MPEQIAGVSFLVWLACVYAFGLVAVGWGFDILAKRDQPAHGGGANLRVHLPRRERRVALPPKTSGCGRPHSTRITE